jgi:peptidoglycan/LPS O-acetylase OafA/YrhL
MLVLLCHSLILILNPSSRLHASIELAGYFGVEIFFCLSGFLVGSIFLDVAKIFDGNPSGILHFMMRRWFRTVPNYYFYLALNTVSFMTGFAFLGNPPDIKYLFFAQNLLAPHPLFFPEAWSLSVEEVFYVLLPFTFVFAWAIFRKTSFAIAVALGSILLFSMGLRAHAALYATDWEEQLRKVALLRLDSLIFGVLLAVAYRKLLASRTGLRLLTGICLLSFLPVSIYMVLMGPSWIGERFMVKLFLFTMTSLGVCGILLLGIKTTLPRAIAVPAAWIAKLSYSLYLSNLTSFYFVGHVFGGATDLGGYVYRASIYVSGALLLSSMTYSFVEKPSLRIRDRYFPSKKVNRIASELATN